MKVVILAGGFGTRLSEETDLKPKPMVEIGDKPILWHIMKIYSQFGFNDFILCLGYKGYMIKEYFHNYFLHNSSVTMHLRDNHMDIHDSNLENWHVSLVDTGLNTMTGGRIKRIEKYVRGETFMLTYGDGVGNIDIPALLESHKHSGRIVTLTAAMPSGRFGGLHLGEKSEVLSFQEKPKGDGNLVNAGFFVLNPRVFDYIKDDATMFEKEPLESLAKDGQLNAFKHIGFWKPMDTLRDKTELNAIWNAGKADWKSWED